MFVRAHVTDYTTIIIITLVGFIALAAVLLVPVYLFLRREEKAGHRFTEKERSDRPAGEPPRNGVPEAHEPPHR